MRTLGIAVWGLGRHARNRILPALSSVNELSLVGICSRNEALVKDCAKQWSCNGWLDPDDMLASENVDIVYIATPIGVHYKLSKQALKAGKHVWCEKPLTCNYEDTKSLVILAKQKKKMLAEGFMYLYHSQFNKLLSYVNDKENGSIQSIICRFGFPSLDEPGFRNNPELCGGAFWDVASYPVSAVLALFPNQYDQLLFSELNNKKNSPVDTEGRAILRFSNNITAFLEWRIGVGYKNEIDLWSEKSSFFTDKIFSKPENYQPVYRIRDQNGHESLDYGDKSEQFKEMFCNFYNMIDSPSRIGIEYEQILERARVMNEIVKFAS